jgi:hypothetical protein
MTMAQTARQMVEFAESKLPPSQLRALAAWIEGAGFEDIARDVALENAEEARNQVRAAIAVLRRHFVRSDS